MFTFGDPERFGIKFNLDDHLQDEWMFGRFCYLVGGEEVGLFDLGTSLRDVLFLIERIEADRGRRDNPRFAAMSGHDAFVALNAAFYGGETLDVSEEIINEEQWARQKVLPPVDIFDGERLFLVAGASAERLLRRTPTGVQETFLRKGEFDLVLREAVEALEAVFESLGGEPR